METQTSKNCDCGVPGCTGGEFLKCCTYTNCDDGIHQCRLHRYAPMLLEAAKAWMLVESEMKDNHPCPDLILRAEYRKRAVMLTKTVLALIED